jgi:hypothetical protein
VVRLNKPTSTGEDDPKEIHYQKDRVQSTIQRESLKPKSLIHPYLTLTQQRRTKYKREKNGLISPKGVLPKLHYCWVSSSSAQKCLLCTPRTLSDSPPKIKVLFSFFNKKAVCLLSFSKLLDEASFLTDTHMWGQKVS